MTAQHDAPRVRTVHHWHAPHRRQAERAVLGTDTEQPRAPDAARSVEGRTGLKVKARALCGRQKGCMCREVGANSTWADDEDGVSPREGGRQQRRRGACPASFPSHASVTRAACACLGGRVKQIQLMKHLMRQVIRGHQRQSDVIRGNQMKHLE